MPGLFDQLGDLAQGPELGQGDLNEGGSGGWSPEQQQSFGGNMDQLGGLADFFGKQSSDEEKAPVKPEITIKDGVIGLKGIPMETAQAIYGGFQQHQKTQAAFNAEALRLQQQENAIRSNPLMSILSAVAAGAAQDPRMPAIVRALGSANAALNPSPDALAQRRLGIMQTLAQMEHQDALSGETFRHHRALEETAAQNAGTRALGTGARIEGAEVDRNRKQEGLDERTFRGTLADVQKFKPGMTAEDLGKSVHGWEDMDEAQRSQVYSTYLGAKTKELKDEADRAERRKQGADKVAQGAARVGIAKEKAGKVAAPKIKDPSRSIAQADAAIQGALAQAARDEAGGKPDAALAMRKKAKILANERDRLKSTATAPAAPASPTQGVTPGGFKFKKVG